MSERSDLERRRLHFAARHVRGVRDAGVSGQRLLRV
jgi:succinate dehydrogenase flavin-adding protein (antitoxin of CptAB toxin-antitoxin module)